MCFKKADIKHVSYSEYYRLTILLFKYSQWKGKIYYMLTYPFIIIGNAPLGANQLVIYWPGNVHEARKCPHLGFIIPLACLMPWAS